MGTDGVYDDGNSKQAFSFSVSPYSRHRLGRYLDILSRTTFDLVDAENSDISGSGGVDFMLTLQSGRHFTRFPWSISFRDSVVDQENRTDERRSSGRSG